MSGVLRIQNTIASDTKIFIATCCDIFLGIQGKSQADGISCTATCIRNYFWFYI